MRIYCLVGLLAIASTGCTNHQLRQSTVNQASTLSDLQFQQVLDNLAMFAANPSALPWQVSLKNGSSQVADSGSASLTGSFGNMMGRVATGTPGAVGSRTIVEQWGNVPITDDNELRLLQIAYRRAFGYQDTLDDDDFANGLAHELKKQVSVTDDFKPLYDRLFKNAETLDDVKKISDAIVEMGISRSEYDILNAYILATNDDRLILEEESVASPSFQTSKTKEVSLDKLLGFTDDDRDALKTEMENGKKNGNPVVDPKTLSYSKLATPVIQEVRRLVKETESDLEEIKPLWFGVSCSRKEIPSDACYVGHYQDRCGERYVWVCPQERENLAKFTLKILSLSTLLEDRQIVTFPGGPAYAPSSAYAR